MLLPPPDFAYIPGEFGDTGTVVSKLVRTGNSGKRTKLEAEVEKISFITSVINASETGIKISIPTLMSLCVC